MNIWLHSFCVTVIMSHVTKYIDCAAVTELQTDHYCVGPRVLTTDNGRIISHPRFNSTSYGHNLLCLWVIIAPMHHVISIQTTFLSIEYSPDCAKDSLTLYNGNGIDSRNIISHICGSSTSTKTKSLSNAVTIQFKTDSTGNGMGFQLRYMFYKESPGIVKVSNESVSGVGTCGTLESKCNQSRECISTSWRCDGIKDCGDGGDESGCVTSTCASSTQNCSGHCLPNEQLSDDFTNCPNLLVKFTIPDNANDSEIRTPRSGCSDQPIPNVERRIVGGYIARKGSWPWQVSILHSSGIFCGGSIITSNWIVTAAHCVKGRMNPPDWRVNAGKFTQIRRENTDQIFRATRIIIHEQYNANSNNNDIALMMISGTFQYNNYVQPVCVGRSLPVAGTRCYITGWGQTQGTGGDGYLKQAQVPIVDQGQCNNWYGGGITEGMVCAGYEQGGTDACQGDSGGPLVCKMDSKYQLVGVTSFGNGCAAPRSPGVYTAAPLYLNWMIESLQNN